MLSLARFCLTFICTHCAAVKLKSYLIHPTIAYEISLMILLILFQSEFAYTIFLEGSVEVTSNEGVFGGIFDKLQKERDMRAAATFCMAKSPVFYFKSIHENKRMPLNPYIYQIILF
jgi:hypothetical protein